MFEKLQSDYQRFQEIDAALNDPAVASDPARVSGLAKEHGALRKIALPYREYLALGRRITEAEALRDAISSQLHWPVAVARDGERVSL